MSKVKKLIIAVISVIVLCGGLYGIKYASDLSKYKKIIKEITIDRVDLSKVKDGNYIGKFDAIVIGATVNVKVKNHEIQDIELIKHKNERGKRAEAILEKVVQAQSLQVDTVSGASNSSKVILKAIENALKSGEINQ